MGTNNGYDVLTEINIVKKMHHPHIVRLHEVIEDEDTKKVYLVMDYMKSGAILGRRYWRSHKVKDYKNKKVPIDRSRKYFRQLAKAIDYRKLIFPKIQFLIILVHNVMNVVHRDIKPGNILVDENDDIKLADFGISEMMQNGKMTGNKSGTKYYLPPEIFSEKMINAGRIDIWSMGVTLFYFVHARLPFYSANQDEFKEMLLEEE